MFQSVAYLQVLALTKAKLLVVELNSSKSPDDEIKQKNFKLHRHSKYILNVDSFNTDFVVCICTSSNRPFQIHVHRPLVSHLTNT